ncbi:hypothetical protein, partial [Candidatus Ulvibacter alkanivorans]|uniref:hypothetical protein n=1 Tax=Candidatus Ulvibacter alkanivorans TaxID=2267620 RepID=UPI001444651D
QKLNYFEVETQERAKIVVNHFLEENKPYILFSLANYEYILIIDNGKNYIEKLVLYDKNDLIKLISNTKINKPNDFFKDAFDTNNYHQGFINFSSDFFNGYEVTAHGGTTYFVMYDSEKNKYGESFLSLLVDPNPINKKLYGYLAQKIIDSD